MPSDETALLHIRDNIHAAWFFTEGMSFEAFKASRLHLYAATRALEIISEAARRLSPSFREQHADIPWRQIMGIGNVLRHDYDDVVESMIWQTVQNHLAPLLAAIEAGLSMGDGEVP